MRSANGSRGRGPKGARWKRPGLAADIIDRFVSWGISIAPSGSRSVRVGIRRSNPGVTARRFEQPREGFVDLFKALGSPKGSVELARLF